MVGFIRHKVIIQFWIIMSATLVLNKWLSTASSQKPSASQQMYPMGTYFFSNGGRPQQHWSRTKK